MASEDHVNHPESWTTGNDPATAKQKDFIETLGGDAKSSMNKSEASETIDKLKNQQPQQSATSSGSGGGSAESEPKQPSSDAPISDPKNWATGDEPATGKQKGYIAVMAKEAGEPIPSELNKSEASEKISELKAKTGK